MKVIVTKGVLKATAQLLPQPAAVQPQSPPAPQPDPSAPDQSIPPLDALESEPESFVRTGVKQIDGIWYATLRSVGKLEDGVGNYFIGKGWEVKNDAYVKPLKPSLINSYLDELDGFTAHTKIESDKTAWNELSTKANQSGKDQIPTEPTVAKGRNWYKRGVNPR